MRNGFLRTSLPALLLVCVTSGVLASGGGGGGGMPSMPSASAPSYDPVVEFQKGLDALKASKFKDAQRAFEHVLSVDSRHPQANFLTGYSLSSQGNDKGARRYYEKAIRYDPDLVPAYRELAMGALRLGKRDEAQQTLDALKLRIAACAGTCPKAAELSKAASEIEAALSTGNAPPATDGRTGQRLPLPKTGDQAYLQAVALINEHRYEAAIAQLQDASMALGPHPDLLTYLGFANRKLGRYDIAEGYYRRALAIAPHHVGATEYYGELMVERGDLAGARAMLARLESACDFGCAESDELRRWIVRAERGA